MRRALVLSGGGARGAYEAGVLRFVAGDLPRRLGHPVRIDLLSGTSVGAIHACYLAATADRGPERTERLAAIWTGMRLESLLRVSALEVARRSIGSLLGRVVPALSGGPRSGSRALVDPEPLNRIVREVIPWPSIRRNVAEGHVEALCVTATQVATGRAVVFVESREPLAPGWTPDPSVVARGVEIEAPHALASAAIPLLFPAIRIDDADFVDGGLRFNTPLVPVLRFGADRVLVVALRPPRFTGSEPGPDDPVDSTDPLFLLGKVMSALLLDHLDADLGRMRFVNQILRRSERVYGADYLERINEAARERGEPQLKLIEELVIRPSENLGALANDAFRRVSTRRDLSFAFRILTGTLGRGDEESGAELLSYLLFDREYTAALAELGYADAKRREEDLARFFADA